MCIWSLALYNLEIDFYFVNLGELCFIVIFCNNLKFSLVIYIQNYWIGSKRYIVYMSVYKFL